ncbi:RNA-binding S4 domain-containing protein [Mesosutterella sp. OilRF-GAM-744-9]|uniref:RNA-binding S4 domain-containing protein n=1 Tax=Mesosutterella porci TaxID=2915351 RepID=A0ABS9MPP0_9BURK|nr:RNA-binding S4 domain-containing protein [Mesosutterella sp. oilRF-744-WT-GAM-9]MCG5030319.1 RNA-binding S4 domain-containing protein [Mesosutterella sp. oilRF-744-WT-GAM-9]
MEKTVFELKTEFIKLDSLLKAAGVFATGGEAKEAIQSGRVLVNGRKETRRGAKLRGGETVAAQGREIEVKAGAAAS